MHKLIADWSPEQHAELAELLSRLARELLGAEADRGLLTRSSSAERPPAAPPQPPAARR